MVSLLTELPKLKPASGVVPSSRAIRRAISRVHKTE